MTAAISTFAVPAAHAERLRKLAKEQGKSAGSILAELIDEACVSAGLDVSSNAVRVQPYRTGFIVDLFGDAYRVELPRSGVEALADHLVTIADRGGSGFNLDHDFNVYRQGSGVILEMDVSERTAGKPGGKPLKLHKSMSPDVAREIAKGLLAGLPAAAAA